MLLVPSRVREDAQSVKKRHCKQDRSRHERSDSNRYPHLFGATIETRQGTGVQITSHLAGLR